MVSSGEGIQESNIPYLTRYTLASRRVEVLLESEVELMLMPS